MSIHALTSAEVRAWISNITPLFCVNVIIYPWPKLETGLFNICNPTRKHSASFHLVLWFFVSNKQHRWNSSKQNVHLTFPLCNISWIKSAISASNYTSYTKYITKQNCTQAVTMLYEQIKKLYKSSKYNLNAHYACLCKCSQIAFHAKQLPVECWHDRLPLTYINKHPYFNAIAMDNTIKLSQKFYGLYVAPMEMYERKHMAWKWMPDFHENSALPYIDKYSFNVHYHI